MMYLIVPLSVTLWEGVTQLVVARLVFTNYTQVELKPCLRLALRRPER
jgi:hypothetical protein